MSYVVFDLETGVKSAGKRKASPFNPDNAIVAIGWKGKGGSVQGSYSRDGSEHDPLWFSKLLVGTKLLVGQNIKFDILYAITRSEPCYQAYMEWVEQGGLVWDCQLAEYLLRGQEQSAHMLSMDEMVEEYGGNLKVDEVKAMWDAGIDTCDIPEDLLMRYLCGWDTPKGRVFGDIENTEAIFLGQLAKVRKKGNMKSVMLNMGSLLASTEMEKNGMAIDMELGLKQAEALEKEIAELRQTMQEFIPGDLPWQFNWGSGKQLSALIFGGVIPYEAKVEQYDDDGKPVYSKKRATAYELVTGEYVVPGVDLPQEEFDAALAGGNIATYKAGKKKGAPRTKQVDVDDHARGVKTRKETFYYTFPGYTEPEAKWETKNEGVYATNSDVIDALGTRDIPFLKQLTKLNKKVKDLTTYYITVDEKTQMPKGMLTMVGPDGLIHGSINHTSTVTGRFSASNPNLQNIPRADTSEVKKLFVSRWGADGSVVQSDFTALEIYIQALLTKDKNLLADLKAGLDMHCKRVSAKFGIPYEEAVQRCKKLTDAPDYKLWKSRRTGAKEFSFQRAYGAGAATIAEATGMTLQDVEELIIAEEKMYPKIEPFYVQVTARINESRKPTSKWVNHPDIRGLNVQLGKGWYTTPDGKTYTYNEYPAHAASIKRGGPHASFSPPEIKNYIVQGTGGEWAKAAMWLCVRALYARKNFDGKALLMNMVHDAQYIDAHNSVREEAAAVLHAAMVCANELMESRFEWEVQAPVPAETSYGPAMYYETVFDSPEFKQRVSEIRQELRDKYLNGYIPSWER